MALSFIRLYSGQKFYLLDPKPQHVTLEAIVHSLSLICRFTGHTRDHYSVLQHSCLVHDIVPKVLRPEGLCHDFGESLVNDLSTQLKSLVPQYREIEHNIEVMLAKKFRLKFPFPADVKHADMVVLVTELRDLLPGADYKSIPFTPLEDKIVPWTPEKSRREFMKRYNALPKRRAA